MEKQNIFGPEEAVTTDKFTIENVQYGGRALPHFHRGSINETGTEIESGVCQKTLGTLRARIKPRTRLKVYCLDNETEAL